MNWLNALLVMLSFSLFSCAEPQSNTFPDHSDFFSHLSARAPMQFTRGKRDSAKRSRPPIDATGLSTEEKYTILTGVGQSLQAKQKSAEQERAESKKRYTEYRDKLWNDLRNIEINIPRRRKALMMEGKALVAIDKADLAIAKIRAAELRAEHNRNVDPHSKRFEAALRTKKDTAQDIKNLGLIDKNMRARMLKFFQPIGLPGREAREIREKAGGPQEPKRKYTKKGAKADPR